MKLPIWIKHRVQGLALIGLLLFGNACGTKSTADEVVPDADTQTITDNGTMDMLMLDGVQITEDGFDGDLNGISSGRSEGCGTVNLNLQQGILGINFGTSGCVGEDGRNRSGTINVSFRGGRFHEENAQITITYVNYIVDGYVLNGVVTVNNFKLQPNRSSYSINTTNFVVAYPNNGGQISFTAQRDIDSNRGRNLRSNDNEWRIKGITTGTNRLGQRFSYNITEPLIVLGSCLAQRNPYPVRGKINGKLDNRPEGQLDWGIGACDKQATIKFENVTRVITLP